MNARRLIVRLKNIMPIYKDDALKLIESYSDKFKEDFQSYIELLAKLTKEDDWSFVIKSHAFIEMFTSEFIVEQTDDKKFQGIIQRLPLSDSTIGKLAICKDLGLLDKSQRKFIRFYSELRNKLVHRFENVNFSFSEYIKSLNENQIKKWKNSIIWFPVEGNAKKTWHSIAVENPKTALWVGIVMLASLFNIDSSRKRVRRDVNKLALETSERLLSELLET